MCHPNWDGGTTLSPVSELENGLAQSLSELHPGEDKPDSSDFGNTLLQRRGAPRHSLEETDRRMESGWAGCFRRGAASIIMGSPHVPAGGVLGLSARNE